MPYVPVTNVAQCDIRYLYDNQRIENTIYFKGSVAWTPALLQDLAKDIRDTWATEVMIDLTAGLTLTSVRVVDLTTQNGAVAEHVESAAGQNTSGAPLPGSNAFVIKFTTSNRGRSFRGRIYLPGLNAGMLASPNVLNVSQADNLLGDIQGGIATIEGLDAVDHVVVSRISNGIPRVLGLATPVESYSYTDRNVDSQRKRLTGRGQ